MQKSDSSKLTFRHWLTTQIDNGEFPGLQWEERKVDGGTFRLPWEKKDGVGWDHQLRLYKAWAVRRGGDENDMKAATLKSNFRLNINKNDSFKELKNKHHLGKQSGNYKVYKLLSREELEGKKTKIWKTRKRKKISGSEQISMSNQDNCDSSVHSSAKSNNEQPAAKLSAQCSSRNAENAKQCSQKVEVSFMTNTPTSPATGYAASATARNISNLFNIEIYYNGKFQLEHKNLDLSQGLRMHHGSNKNSELGEVLQKYNNDLIDGSLDIFSLVNIEFPKPANSSPSLERFLKSLHMGLTVHYENQKLLVKRSCRLRIFGIGSSEDAKKIERYQKEVITDFKKMRLNGPGRTSTMCAWLACGVIPKQHCQPGKGIWVKFVPSILAQYNKKAEAFTSDCHSIQISEMTDLERLLDMLYVETQA